jgi:DNA repair protein RecO (recombination protein O)
METERAEAIVLRCQPVTESSLLVTWFTREFGKLKMLAKGARRPKSPVRGKIDLFYRDEILFLRSRRSDLHLLHDCFLETPRARLRQTMGGLTAASYASELVDVATELEDANPAVFELLDQTLDALTTRVTPVVLIWFELQLLQVIGWAPPWRMATGSAVEKVLGSLTATSLPGARRVRLSEAQLAEARQLLWNYWDEQVGKTPRSRALLSR